MSELPVAARPARRPRPVRGRPSDRSPRPNCSTACRIVHGAIIKLTALLTRFVAVGEGRQVHRADGMATMKAWLTGHLRMSGNEAAGYLVRAGRRLEQLPELAAAFAEGAVSAAHVQVVTAAITPARVAKAAEVGVDLATTDRVLTEAARVLGPEDTGKAVRRWVAGVDPDGLLGRLRGPAAQVPDGCEQRRAGLPDRASGPGRRGDRARRPGGGDERPPPRR